MSDSKILSGVQSLGKAQMTATKIVSGVIAGILLVGAVILLFMQLYAPAGILFLSACFFALIGYVSHRLRNNKATQTLTGASAIVNVFK